MIYELVILNEYEQYSHTIDLDECISSIRDRQINSFNTFEFSVISDNQIKKGYHILFKDYDLNKWHEYIVDKVIKSDEKTVFLCESSFYSTLSNFVEFVDITGNTVDNGLTKIFNSSTPLSDWNVGRSNIAGSFYMQRSRKQLKEVLLAWTNTVNGEISERIEFYNHHIVRYLDILSNVGEDRGKTIYDDREIQNIDMTIPSGYTYTSAFGYGASTGADENGNAILTTFADVEWSKANGDPADKPKGQTWLELGEDYKDKYGILVSGQKYHRVTIANFNNVQTPINLLKKTYDYLISNIQDKTQYSVKSIDLKKLSYDTEDMLFGDTIRVFVSKFDNLRLKARVSRYREDFINPANNLFELNNFRKTITSQMNEIQNDLIDIGNKIDGVSKSFTGSILEKWNQEINADSAFLMYGDPINGLIAYNASTIETATKATRLKGGSLQIANRKENGEFVWTTVMTGDGIVANTIYTGLLSGNFFDFDLDSGVIKMGKRNANGIIENPSFYLDASGEMHLKSVAEIEKDVNEIKLTPEMRLIANFGTQQVYAPSSDTYIPDFTKQPLTITPEIKLLGVLQQLDPSKIVWSKKNGTLNANEVVSNGVLTVKANIPTNTKNVTYVCTYNYAEGKSKSVELSFSLVSDGEDTLVLQIISSNGSIFKNGNIQTTLSAVVRKGMDDITDRFDDNQFIWTRKSSDSEGDAKWNSAHFGGTKQISITNEDVYSRATFFCDLIDTTTRMSLLGGD